MLAALVQFIISAAVIAVAATFLARFADALAELTRLGRLVVGSVLLAGATSLPELVVTVSAVRLGAIDLAVGDLLGATLMNLLILAVLDLSHYSRGEMLSCRGAAHALSGTFSMTILTIVALGLVTAKAAAPYQLLGVGPALLIALLAYVAGIRLVYLDQQFAVASLPAPPDETSSKTHFTLLQASLGFVTCAAVLILVGPYLAHAADHLAELSGLGRTFIGTTLVALTTTLPECVSMITALRMRATELVIGNVFGSNAFNMILLLPVDAVYDGSLLAAASPRHVVTCLAAILATQVVVLGQLYHVEARRKLVDPDAWLVIAIVLGGLALIYFLPG